MWFLSHLNENLALLAIQVLKFGPIPKHIAFILDGNRRYAKLHGKSAAYGHRKGCDRIKNIAKWCTKIGVKELTMFGFSIENFKRDPEEVREVFRLINVLLEEITREIPDAKLILAGNLDLLPEDLRKAMARKSLDSSGNDGLIVNVAIAYTARHEMTNALQVVRHGVQNGFLEVEDIDEELLTQCLYVQTEPDILLRTSGESRLSDFLLWQVRFSQVYFVNTAWPKFNIWLLLALIFRYQTRFKCYEIDGGCESGSKARKELFLGMVRNDRLQALRHYAYD